MRQFIPLVLLAFYLTGCTYNPEDKLRKEALSIAEDYVCGNLGDTTRLVLDNGTMIIGDGSKTYAIFPEKIFTGYVDEDNKTDAIISLSPFLGNIGKTTEHLFLINISGKLTLIRTIESDMRIINIEDGIITAEIPEHTRDNPLFNCPSCWDVVKYRFVNGELERIDE